MSADQWTVKDILQWTSQRFTQQGLPTPLLDAQLLLGSVLGLTKVQLYMGHDRLLGDDERARMRDLVKRRVAGEPVAYLLGRKEWHDLDLHVDSRVLIPRPETETLLDFVIEVFRASKRTPRAILDLCTGSGCLALSLGKRFPDARVVAVEISSDALAVARLNAARNGIANVEFIQGNVTDPALFDRLQDFASQFDVIVSNPPYVSEAEWVALDPGVRDFEPKLALTADDDGLSVARTIAAFVQSRALLLPNAVFGMEVGLAHCERLRTEQGAALVGTEDPDVFSFAYNTAAWRFPRGAGFALQDLTGRDRFWCQVNGLPYAAFAVVDETRRMATEHEEIEAAVDAVAPARAPARRGASGDARMSVAELARLEAKRQAAEDAALAAAAREDESFPEDAL